VARSHRRLLPYLSDLQARWLSEEPCTRWRQVDASLVFADVSGFTPLSEKLARKGKVGAEELTAILNGLFGDLLAVSAQWGGDCLKFGGDAVLLLFTGEAHAGRAEASARGMLDSLRRFRRSAGLRSVGMSIGLHSGPVLATLAGDSHRELMVVGPAVTETLLAEHTASSGEIRLSVAASKRLEEDVQGARVPMPADAPRSESAWELSAPAGLPLALGEFLTGEPQNGEHRLVSVGFVQFSGSDELLLAQGPQALCRALDDLVRTAQSAGERHGVTLLASDVDAGGGKLILAAGAPSSTSDDEDRLLHALTDIVSSGSELALRAGANRGRVFVVDLGAPSRRAFTVIGDAVNLAARVMGKAEPGQVLATRQILERARTNFQIQMVEPFPVKGKSDLIEAGIVGQPVGLLPDVEPENLPLIGRQAEQQLIRDAIERASQGTGSIIEIVGEPGIGKSKLVKAAVVDAPVRVVTIRAGRYSQATPYFALRGALRGLLGIAPDAGPARVASLLREALEALDPELVPWGPLIGHLLGLELEETRQTAALGVDFRAAKQRAVGATLLYRLIPGAGLIIIEDAHWLDAASADLLRDLMGMADRPPWVFLITRRPSGEGMNPADLSTHRLALDPLADDEAARLVATSLASVDAGVPRHVAKQLVARSGGNPLFLIELLRAATTQGLEDLPDTVEAVISTMIDTLPPDDRSLVRRAAVIGQRFPLSVMATTVDLDERQLARRLTALRHFLRLQSGFVEFDHALLRDVAYENLPFRARRELHARAGNAWEALSGDGVEEVAELLSVHFHAAGDHCKTWRYSRIAGQKAERAAAPIEAAAFYQHALEASRYLSEVTPQDEASIAERLGDMTARSGHYSESRSAYARARRLFRDQVPQARLHRKSALTWDQEGRYRDAARACRRGLKALDSAVEGTGTGKERSKLLAQHGVILLRQARHLEARPELEEAVRLARESSTGAKDSALARAYRYLDWLYIELATDPPEPYGRMALELYEHLGDKMGMSQSLNNMGIAAYYRGEWDESVALYERSRLAASEAGSILTEALVLNNIAEIRSDQGHLEEAEELFREALAIWRSARHGFEGMTLGNQARLAARAGRFEESALLYREATAILQSQGEKALLAETKAREAELSVLAGVPDEALRGVEVSRRLADRLLLPNTSGLIERVEAWARIQQGDIEGGWDRLAQTAVTSRNRRDDYGAAAALDSMARLADERGEGPSARRTRREAASLFERLGLVKMPQVPFEMRLIAV
jgi:class 3 adenylate cyclase/tetratricopeptide (TPR) repeat protein